jgi:hypothetical protein
VSFLKQLFRREDRQADMASRMFTQFGPDASTAKGSAPADALTTRRELMRTALRKTLARHGIPAAWIGSEMLVATSRSRESGMHWRIVVRHWDPRLLEHSVALQNSLVARLVSYDPLAADWLMGISWQFALANEAACPPMPQPGYWTADHRPVAAAPAAAPLAEPAIQPSADVIAGPVRIGTPRSTRAGNRPREADDSLRDDLDKLLAVRDAELQRHAFSGPEATQPMYLKTEPQPLAPTARPLP